MKISSVTFLSEVATLGFACWSPRDVEFTCPSEDWLKEFANYLLQSRTNYNFEAWDCDDFALQAVTEASMACCKSGFKTGHTVVYCTLRIWGSINGWDVPFGTAHACNLIKLDTGKFVLFEPQNGKYCDAQEALDSGSVVPVNALL